MARTDPARQLALPNVLPEASDGADFTGVCPTPATDVPPVEARILAPEVRAARDATVDDGRAVLEGLLTRAVGAPLTLAITDNRRTMLSIQRRSGVRCVRLHQMFLNAPGDVLAAVGRYLAHGDRRAGARIDRYIADNRHRIRAKAPGRAVPLETRGTVHDLAALRDQLAETYFGGPIDVAITWGRSGSSLQGERRRRTIRMGTYYIDDRLIRIHPALDQDWIPTYFIAWVIYHEMLHHLVPMPVVNGRRCYHTAEFRARERLFADGERAREWERSHLRQLIASRDA